MRGVRVGQEKSLPTVGHHTSSEWGRFPHGPFFTCINIFHCDGRKQLAEKPFFFHTKKTQLFNRRDKAPRNKI